MAWWLNIVRLAIAASIIVAVAELSRRYPRAGALLLSLPLIFSWFQYQDLPATSKVARETLILVPLGLPFFVPLAFAQRWGLTFWPALALGLLLAGVTIGAWLWLAPQDV